MTGITRRDLLLGSLGAGAALLTGCGSEDADVGQAPGGAAFAGGERLEVLAWPYPDPPPFGRKLARGWDGRRFTDLQELDPDALVTPTDRFFLRTFAPPRLAAARDTLAADWSIRVEGLEGRSAAESQIPLASLAPRPLGAVLIECAGNDASAQFGLMSCARWDGVPLLEALAGTPAPPGAAALQVSGVDEHDRPSRGGHSTPGAAWVFSLAQLRQTGAFLATGMNGAPLLPDHGAPVRLVVPGWYGCCHVKWVDALRWVGADEPATAQMREFAARTHQRGVPALTRDYRPAAVDAAALPVRVERWRVRGESHIRVVGIAWGGDGRANELRVRIDPDGRWERVALESAASRTAWRLWEHAWQPRRSGLYTIRCRIDGGRVPQRRQAAGLYDRSIQI